jgi:hypothetical protein
MGLLVSQPRFEPDFSQIHVRKITASANLFGTIIRLSTRLRVRMTLTLCYIVDAYLAYFTTLRSL